MPDNPDGRAPLDDDPHLLRPIPPRSLRERLEHLADATGSSPARILVGGALAVVAVAGGFWLLRPPPEPPEAALPFARYCSRLARRCVPSAPPVVATS